MLPLVKIKDLSAFIPGLMSREPVLRSIDLQINDGEHLYIGGPNGAGKSSLLRLVHGDLCPSAGSILWRGLTGKEETSRIIARLQTALVSPFEQEKLQNFGWNMPVKDWLTRDFSLDPFPETVIEKRELEAQAKDWLERLGAPNIWQLPLNALSQGQMRLCLLARAFLREVPLLLLDEYADGLDPAHRKRLDACLENLRDSRTMVFISHRPENVPPWCEKFMEMRQGMLKALSSKPSSDTGTINTRSIKEKAKSSEEILAEVHNATVYVNGQKVLKNISWECRKGEHWHISGENGAGKSTFLRLLAGDEMVALGGYARVRNAQEGRWANSLAEKRHLVSLVSDKLQACYAYDLSVMDLLCSGFDNSIGIYREISTKEKEMARNALQFFFPKEQASFARLSAKRLSSGQTRRLFLARAFMTSPSLLLLDEPFSLLDSDSRIFMRELLQELGTKGWHGIRPAIIFVTHQEEDIPACVSRKAEIHDGHLTVKI